MYQDVVPSKLLSKAVKQGKLVATDCQLSLSPPILVETLLRTVFNVSASFQSTSVD